MRVVGSHLPRTLIEHHQEPTDVTLGDSANIIPGRGLKGGRKLQESSNNVASDGQSQNAPNGEAVESTDENTEMAADVVTEGQNPNNENMNVTEPSVEPTSDIAIAGGFSSGSASANVYGTGAGILASAFGYTYNSGYASSYADRPSGESTGAGSSSVTPALAEATIALLEGGYAGSYGAVESSSYGLSVSVSGDTLNPIDIVGDSPKDDSPSGIPFFAGSFDGPGAAFGAFGAQPDEDDTGSSSPSDTVSSEEVDEGSSTDPVNETSEEVANETSSTSEEGGVSASGSTEAPNQNPGGGFYGGFGAIP